MDWFFRLFCRLHHNLLISSCCNNGPTQKSIPQTSDDSTQTDDSSTQDHLSDEEILLD